MLILGETYIAVTVKESQVQPTRLEFLFGILFFLRPPGNGNDLGVITPGLFPQNRSQKQSQVYVHSLLVPVPRRSYLPLPTCCRMRNWANHAVDCLLAFHTVCESRVWQSTMTRTDTVKEVERRRYTDGATCANPIRRPEMRTLDKYPTYQCLFQHRLLLPGFRLWHLHLRSYHHMTSCYSGG